MHRRFLLSAAVVAGALGATPLAALAQDAAKKTRVVVQVSEADPARWNLVLNNVKNLQDVSAPATSKSRSSPTDRGSAC